MYVYVQWLAEKLDFLAVYDIKWGYFEWRLHTLKVLLCCSLSYVYNDMTWGPKKLTYTSVPYLVKMGSIPPGIEFFSEFQLSQVTVL